MKSLKFDHDQVDMVRDGSKTSTWRLNDDKNISVNDEIRLVDKVDPTRPETWRVFGVAHVDRILEKRLGDIDLNDMEGHRPFDSKDKLLKYYQHKYNNDVSLTTPLKMIFFTFRPLEQGDVVEVTTEGIKSVKVYADGGSRGNPGPSASGFVIIDPNTNSVLVDKGIYLGITTNNQAEYLALKYGLEEAVKMGIREVDAYMDSMLVVNQLNGTFKVSNRDLYPIYDAVKKLLGKFSKFTVSHVPREMNKLADAAVNRAMDEALHIENGSDRKTLMS